MIPRPGVDEYAPFYAGYVARVPDGDVSALLAAQIGEVVSFLRGLAPAQADFAYAPGKWTVKEVVGHLADAERVFSYRALRFARGDRTPLASFEETAYVIAGQFPRRPLADLTAELAAVRAATIPLVASLDAEALARRGIASGKEVSVRALVYIVAGHVQHHLEILRTRYA